MYPLRDNICPYRIAPFRRELALARAERRRRLAVGRVGRDLRHIERKS